MRIHCKFKCKVNLGDSLWQIFGQFKKQAKSSFKAYPRHPKLNIMNELFRECQKEFTYKYTESQMAGSIATCLSLKAIILLSIFIVIYSIWLYLVWTWNFQCIWMWFKKWKLWLTIFPRKRKGNFLHPRIPPLSFDGRYMLPHVFKKEISFLKVTLCENAISCKPNE